jgi:hypothetical protein
MDKLLIVQLSEAEIKDLELMADLDITKTKVIQLLVTKLFSSESITTNHTIKFN